MRPFRPDLFVPARGGCHGSHQGQVLLLQGANQEAEESAALLNVYRQRVNSPIEWEWRSPPPRFMMWVKADTRTAAPTSTGAQGREARGPGRRPRQEERRLSVSHSPTPAGGETGQREEAGPLLLKESCHFDSHHQGNGCVGPQSSALLGGGGGVCAAPISTSANLHHTRAHRQPGRSVVTAYRHGDKQTNAAMSAISGTRRGAEAALLRTHTHALHLRT